MAKCLLIRNTFFIKRRKKIFRHILMNILFTEQTYTFWSTDNVLHYNLWLPRTPATTDINYKLIHS